MTASTKSAAAWMDTLSDKQPTACLWQRLKEPNALLTVPRTVPSIKWAQKGKPERNGARLHSRYQARPADTYAISPPAIAGRSKSNAGEKDLGEAESLRNAATGKPEVRKARHHQSHRRLPLAVRAGQTPTSASLRLPEAAPRISSSDGRQRSGRTAAAPTRPGSTHDGIARPASRSSARSINHASISLPATIVATSPSVFMVASCAGSVAASCITISRSYPAWPR